MAHSKANRASQPSARLKHAAVGAFLFGIVAMAQVLPHFSTYKFGSNITGAGSDSYSFLYSMWLAGQPSDGVVRTESRDLLTGYPRGRAIQSPIQVGSILSYGLAKLGLTPVAAYNITIGFCFFAAYFFGFLILSSLGVSPGVSYLGAFAIGLHPYQTLQSADHLDLAMTWVLLLDIWLLVRLMAWDDLRALPAIVALTGFAVFSHPYYLIMLALTNALPLAWAVLRIAGGRFKLGRRERLAHGCATLVAGAVALASVLAWKGLFDGDAGSIGDVKRNVADLYVYSTKFWDFVLPPHFSLPFARWTTALKTEVTVRAGSNFVENTLYPGVLVLLGLPVGVGLFLLRPGRRSTSGRSGARLLLANLIVVPLLLSISPSFDIFGWRVPTPTAVLYELVPQFRTMSRFGYVSAIGMILACAWMLDAVLQRWRGAPARRTLIVLVLGFVFTLDFGYFHQDFYSDTSLVPPVYTYLRDSTPPESVIFEVPFAWGYLTTYWQSYHHRRNFAAFDPGAAEFPLLASTAGMDLAGLIRFCGLNKIDYLVLHTDRDTVIPGAIQFEAAPDTRWIHFLFARHSYVVKCSP